MVKRGGGGTHATELLLFSSAGTGALVKIEEIVDVHVTAYTETAGIF